jgi:hypothetical protein
VTRYNLGPMARALLKAGVAKEKDIPSQHHTNLKPSQPAESSFPKHSFEAPPCGVVVEQKQKARPEPAGEEVEERDLKETDDDEEYDAGENEE